MINRCHNPKHMAFKRYGAKGVTVCDEWRADFQNFLRDMGPRPSPKHTIDRVERSEGYSRSNCRWATRKVQDRNRSDNRILEFEGRALPLAQWAALSGLTPEALHLRLKAGWDLADALTVPPGRKRSR